MVDTRYDARDLLSGATFACVARAIAFALSTDMRVTPVAVSSSGLSIDHLLRIDVIEHRPIHAHVLFSNPAVATLTDTALHVPFE